MTRLEAILAIAGVWSQLDQEFCVYPQERKLSENEMREAFRALGVTDEEYKEAQYGASWEAMKIQNEQKIELRRAIAAVMENSAGSVMHFDNPEALRAQEGKTDAALRLLWQLTTGELINSDPVDFFLGEA